ncbi:MAG: Rpn family recombination-promoting nuclease/putative transposase [Deltaproteobacteria bacterium]|jgi:hypothetical protein|nr:Rpn family recombination-promoting nuclease/putative transposase [Deltaproteobacteria bacterium]
MGIIELLPPLNDFVFRLIFSDRQRPEVLASLIIALLPEQAFLMKDLTVIDPLVNVPENQSRTGLVSALVTSNLGAIHNIEILVSSNPLERVDVALYAKNRHIYRMIQGMPEAQPRGFVTTILLADYQLSADSTRFVSRADFELSTGPEVDAIKTVGSLWSYQLPNLKEEMDNQALKDWVDFFRARTLEEFREVSLRNRDILSAREALEAIEADPSSLASYRAWREAHANHLAQVYRGKGPAELWPEAMKRLIISSTDGDDEPPTCH